MAATRDGAAMEGQWRGATLCGLAVALAGLVYAGALRNPFVFDDHVTVVGNAALRDPAGLRALLLQSVFRPVVTLSYALDHALWGLRPFGFHLTSLQLHMTNVVLLFCLGWLAVEDWRAQAGDGRGWTPAPGTIAFVAAALFAVHPLQTEAVGYVSGRAELLCATFFLLGLLALRAGLRHGGRGRVAAALALFVLALGSKEVAAAWPGVALVYDRLLLGGDAAVRRRRLWRLHLPLIGLVALAGAARLLVFFRVENPTLPAAAWWQYVLSQPGVVWRYLGLLVAPVSQSIVQPVEPPTTGLDAAVALAALAGLAALGGLAFAVRRRDPLVALGAAWLFLLLAPSSTLVPLDQPMAEHRVYLASAGFFLAVAAGGSRLGAWLGRRAPRWRLAPGAALVVVLGGLALLTVARNRVWADPVTLWGDAARKAPAAWAAHHGLGDALAARGRCGEAIPEYEAAVRLFPLRSARPYTNLWICLAELRRFDEAYRVLETAARIDPGVARAQHNLGVLASLSGDAQAARRHLRQAIAEEPRNVTARRHLAALYETRYADPAEALRLCREIRGLAPETAGVEECIRRNERRLAPR